MPSTGKQDQLRVRDTGCGGTHQFWWDDPIAGATQNQHGHADLAEPPGHVPALNRFHEHGLASRPTPTWGQPERGQQHQP